MRPHGAERLSGKPQESRANTGRTQILVGFARLQFRHRGGKEVLSREMVRAVAVPAMWPGTCS